MIAREVRQRVLDAVERGEIPPGGPSEVAGLDMLDEAPPDYWRRWSDAAAERIRAQVRCRCELEPESVTDDGRCGRCYGRRAAP